MKMATKSILSIIIIAALLVAGWLYLVKGYISMKIRHAVPPQLTYNARIPGIKDVRVIIDPIRLIKRENTYDIMYKSALSKPKFSNPEINALSISGGGANGAYGAGILCGWTKAGDRPVFDVVTGVSTGALIAPAAFAGTSYDSLIKDIYTNISDADIMKQNFIDFLLEGRPSILDTQPLRNVLKKAVSKKLIDEIAREHVKGRRLYIATTNLDARRGVIWDMGAIATVGTPESIELFRDVMIASASIPVAFPPVMIKVEADGRIYEEMHVDGSVATQSFGSGIIMGSDEAKTKKVNFYLIKNGKFADAPEQVPLKIWDIAGAAFSTLMTWQSYGDIFRSHMLAKYENMNLYFTFIPQEFNEPRKGEFDLDYMRKLFYRGFRTAQSGGYWTRDTENSAEEVIAPGK